MDLDYLGILFRWMHILAAITAVGGTIFTRAALMPAAATLSDDEHKRLAEAVRSRWAKFVHGTIALLLVSGLYNVARMEMRYHLGVPYHILLTVKILLALVIFFLASMLTGRSEAAQRFRQKGRYWVTVNMTLAIIVVCISGVMRDISRSAPAKVKTPPAVEQPAEPAKP